MSASASMAARHSSESVEHFTPRRIVDAARRVLGRIDLDPASCELANEEIGATDFFDQDMNGFQRAWWGRVILNPPGGLSDNQERRVTARCRETGSCGLAPGHVHDGVEASQKKWWFKLAREYVEGRVEAAVFVGFSVEILQVTQHKAPPGIPTPLDFPLCFPAGRVRYDKVQDGARAGSGSPPHASVLVYLPPVDEPRKSARARFAEEFAPLGRVINLDAEIPL